MYPSILFEDKSIAVLEKGSGMVVNRAGTVASKTLQDWVEEHISFSQTVEQDSDFVKRSGIVHRLDKDTSGIILCAKDEESFYDLQQQFKNHVVEKEYTALCHGSVKEAKGEISVPIGRLPWNRMRFGVLANGREALTFYKVVCYKTLNLKNKKIPLTLVKAYPKTGRTHQIRVHFKHINHPLFGDRFYAGRKRVRDDLLFLNRHFLHASGISFVHPKKGDRVHFMSSLPPDLVAIEEQLQ